MNAEHRAYFKQRLKSIQDSYHTHPRVRWVAQPFHSNKTCLELDGKVWLSDDVDFLEIVKKHLASRSDNCRCRITSLSFRDQQFLK